MLAWINARYSLPNWRTGYICMDTRANQQVLPDPHKARRRGHGTQPHGTSQVKQRSLQVQARSGPTMYVYLRQAGKLLFWGQADCKRQTRAGLCILPDYGLNWPHMNIILQYLGLGRGGGGFWSREIRSWAGRPGKPAGPGHDMYSQIYIYNDPFNATEY